VRIIAGAAKGLKLDVPRSGTRPMTGRARESIFSILGTRVADAKVLDLYAGSGSLGLEAISRGAAGVVFVEKTRQATRAIASNIERIGLGGNIRIEDVASFLASETAQFDVIFIDPPYDDEDREVQSVLEQIGQVLLPDGIVVLHRQARSTTVPPDFLRSVDERRYGDAVVVMMERAKE
jgi:16S rRNA (guanine966-N2)-methyltransferase